MSSVPRRAVAGGASRLVPISLLLLLMVSCRPELLVRLATNVREDGSIGRRLSVTGLTAEGKVPDESRWLERSAGLRLADPDAWDRVDDLPGGLLAEGQFAPGSRIPGVIAHEMRYGSGLGFDQEAGAEPGEDGGYEEERPNAAPGWRRDRDEVSLAIEDLVVLDRWVYRETYGDPFDRTDRLGAIDGMTDLAAEALREELRLELGDDLDPAPAEAFLRGPVKRLAVELAESEHGGSGRSERTAREERWSRILSRAGVSVAPRPSGDENGYWEVQAEGLLAWLRAGVAASVSTPERPVSPEDLGFLPSSGEDVETRIRDIAGHVWGGEDELMERLEPLLGTLEGHYGDSGSPRYRFETTVVMPGRLLRTNGAVDRDGVHWLFRNDDLARDEVVMEAESVAPRDDRLRSLGARRELDTPRLLQLADILSRRDPDGEVRTLLTRAVEAGRLSLLREDNDLSEEVKPLARELADLLDPAVEPAPAF